LERVSLLKPTVNLPASELHIMVLLQPVPTSLTGISAFASSSAYEEDFNKSSDRVKTMIL